MLIDEHCMRTGFCVYFSQLLFNALECEFTEQMQKPTAAKSQQRIFTLFLLWWHSRSLSLLSLSKKQKKTPISNNYENKHFSMKDFPQVRILALQSQEPNSREKSLEMQEKIVWENKRRKIEYSRINATICFMYREIAFMWWFLCLEYRLTVVSDASRMFA